jgi:hypothetical protein
VPGQPTNPQFLGRFRRNRPRMVSLVAGLAALAALIIGAGFAGISKSGSPTTLETLVVRWIVLACLAVGVVTYVVGGRRPADDEH